MADNKLKRQTLQDIMICEIQCVAQDATVREVARLMKQQQIGDVVVTHDDGRLYGIVTDRDLVVRALAEGLDPDRVTAGEICTRQVVTLTPDSSVDAAVELMRERAIRRIPVLREGEPVGIVSIGDLAQLKDPRSALGSISSAPPSE